MSETKQLSFDLREVTTALIKQHGIHEGRWMIGFEFSFAGVNIGPADEEKPAAIVQVSKVLLFRHEDRHPAWLAVDAAEVNPPEG